MTMEVSAKTEVVNGTPLPQRIQKNQQGIKKPIQAQQKQNDGIDGPPVEKKPRFNPTGLNSNNSNEQNKGFNNNNNKNFNNRGNRGNRGNFHAPNRPNLSNQNQQKDIKQQVVENQDLNIKEADPLQQLQQLQQQQELNKNLQAQQALLNRNQNNQNANQNHQNRGGNRGGGGGGRDNRDGDGGGRGRDGRDGGNRDGGHRDGFGGGQGGGNRDRSRGGNRSGGGGGGGQGGGNFGRNDEFFIGQRLRAIAGPTHELPAVESTAEAKFSGRNRLYVGNLTNDVTEEELRELFKPYGEIGEIFSNPDKNFTFLKLDYHANAEKAKRELDGTMRKNRVLRVRFAPNATILRVSNLTQFVSNELLYKAFEIFGPVERANIIVDDRGKHTGEGIVEFGKKSSANCCMRYCNEKCFFLTASLRPCVVENFEVNDDADGLPDKTLNKKSPEFNHERSVGPRFADNGSFEHEYGTRWKQMHELYKTKQDALKRELKMEEEKLEAQMEYARYEHETELLRQELRKRESDNERKKMEWELREKQAEDMRKRDEDNMRRQQTEMQSRMLRQEEEMRRRQQENTLFMQAQQLNSLLDQQEGGFGNAVNVGGGGGGGNANNFDGFGGASNSPFEFRGNSGASGTGGGNSGPTNAQEPFSFEFGGNNQNQGGQGNQRGGTTGGNPNNNNNNPWERRRRF